MRILAIETSCDETAAAIVSKDSSSSFVVVERSVVASQADLHSKYGGVYPEVASREHAKQILPVIAEALALSVVQANRLPDLSLSGINAIAVTQGPGLIGSLLVGVQAAAGLSLVSGLPLLPVNHLAGHIYASFIQQDESFVAPRFPLLALIVSGGHTMLIYMRDHHDYQLLGQTRDDAAGEAFDKVAKLLGLGYPGGPLVSKLARQGNREAYDFPIGLAQEDSYDFSFSGLKTAVLRQVKELPEPLTNETKADVAASFEKAVIEALLMKTAKALRAYPVADVILGGGVAANSYLRDRLGALLAHWQVPVRLHVPEIALCTDNAAVIGAAALFGDIKPCSPGGIQAKARLPLA